MGITRNQLKSIVKECLVEILAEGVGGSLQKLNESKTQSPLQRVNKTIKQQRNRLEQSAALKEAIRVESGGNNVMAEILADTARTTLPSMLESDRSRRAALPSGGVVERTVASSTPEELFGEEAASKWADLAFMNSKDK